MKTKVISESGLNEALYGLGFSRELTNNMTFQQFNQDEKLKKRLLNVLRNLANKENGHNKALESIQVWIEIKAPRYWWSQFDTYRVGVTKQSESSMYNICKRPLVQSDFEFAINDKTLLHLNSLIKTKDFEKIKNELPEGYLQKRVISTNYKVLRNIYKQRYNHKLTEWQEFCNTIANKLEYPEFIVPENLIVSDNKVIELKEKTIKTKFGLFSFLKA